MNSILLVAVAASVCTAIAGILHLTMLPAPNSNMTILFLIGGIAQIFWVIPTIKRWGKTWDIIGIAGTLAFIIIWLITRMPDNPVTGRAGRIGESAIIIEIFQITFIVLLGILISKKTVSPTAKV